MLISIRRHYMEANVDNDMMINTLYIIKIEPTNDPERPRTRILLDVCNRDDPSVIYTHESLSALKGKITKEKNKQLEIGI